jgi:CheY-like chemotaxis protein
MSGKILVVDDEKDILRIVAFSLQKWGYEVITANNGQEGLNKISAEKPDLILLDASMPVMDGFKMLEQLRNTPDWENIPVIMLAAHSDSRYIDTACTYGIVAYITKPFDPEKLKETIEKALSLSHSKSQIQGSKMAGLL